MQNNLKGTLDTYCRAIALSAHKLSLRGRAC